MKTAVYAFSGDPITYGHIDIIRRALLLFDHITIAIGSNPSKKYLFSIDEREDMTRVALKEFGDRVDVQSFSGLLIDFLKENGISYIIRGIRSNSDFEYEKLLSDINKTQNIGIETLFLTSNESKGFISSSASKELVKNMGDVDRYVPMYVKYKMEEKILNSKIIGITGEIGAGKSFVANNIYYLVNYKTNVGYTIFNIDLDEIGRNLLSEYTKPLYVETRYKLVEEFGKDILLSKDNNFFIDRKKLGSKIFCSDRTNLNIFNDIVREPILFKVRQDILCHAQRVLHKSNKLILINSALLIDENLLNIVNNNVIFVSANYETRIERLIQRGYSNEEIKIRMNSQLSFNVKMKLYKESSSKYNYGNHIIIDNNENKKDGNNRDYTYTEIVREFIERI